MQASRKGRARNAVIGRDREHRLASLLEGQGFFLSFFAYEFFLDGDLLSIGKNQKQPGRE
jgi:hypothetical protein